ncbi:MAG: universal stress protein [Thermoleophilia bacterium]|jgi:APA family basic amino acid/polyamine antiporter
MARRRFRKVYELQRVLGWPALYSAAYGNVGSSIYYALGVVAAFALGLSPVVFMLAGLLFALTAFSYAEATAAVPEAGGSSSFARRSFNELASFGAGWALTLDYIITIAISAFFVPNYLAVFFPILKEWPANTIGGIVVVLLLVIINIIGIKESSGLNILLAVMDLITQVLLAVVGIFILLNPEILINNVHWGVAPTWSNLLYGISIAMVAYTGIETVSNLAEEAKQPHRDVPKSIMLVLVTVLAVYAAISTISLSVMPVHEAFKNPETRKVVATIKSDGQVVEEKTKAQEAESDAPPPVIGQLNDAGQVISDSGEVVQIDGERTWVTDLSEKWLEDPIMGIVKDKDRGIASHWPVVAKIMAAWVGILAATILLIATNAGILGISRLTYSMGQHKQLPPIFNKVHSRFHTPYTSIIIFGIVASLLLLPGKVDLLADLYSFGAMISFTIAHISVVALRIKEPYLGRPFKAPLNIQIGEISLPVTAIIGGIGTFTVWVIVVVTHEWGRYVGFSWMILGFIMYFFYRRSQKLSLTETVKIETVPTKYPDVEYNNILVPMVGSRISSEAMVMACQLAAEEKSAIQALVVIEVPMNLPLESILPEEQKVAQGLLDEAKELAEEYAVPLYPKIVAGRIAGRTIVEEAIASKSQIVMIGAERKRRTGERFFGGTVEYVLRKAPCKVLIVSGEKDMK